MEEVEPINDELGHLDFLRVGPIVGQQYKCEKLEELQLEAERAVTFSHIKDGEVLVILIFEQVSDRSKHVIEVDLQEAGVALNRRWLPTVRKGFRS